MAKRKRSSVGRGLELLWGTPGSRSRGPKPALSLHDITITAIALADRDGLASLSMRRVAEKLGFTTMSLYRYVPGKDELVEVMRDAAIGVPPPADPSASWRDELAAWARASLAMHHRHPWLLDVEIRRPPFGPNHLRWLDAGLRIVSALDLDAQHRLRAVLFVDAYVRGFARITVGLAQEERRTGTNHAELEQIYASIFATVAAGGEYPALTDAIAAGGFDPGTPVGDDFEFGLARALDGVEAFVRR
jgi:AcrR family transcriptional regulator